MRPPFEAALLAAAATLAGCHDRAPSPPRAVAPTAPPSISPGHIFGEVTIAGVEHWADGLLTPEGAMRLHIYREVGASIEGSVQFVGDFGAPGVRVAGQGTIIGQFCGTPARSRFCGMAAPADLVLTASSTQLARTVGELRVGSEIWALDLGYWGGGARLADVSRLESLDGLFKERLAEFAPRGDAVISVDSLGRLFVQDETTGCTANGSLQPVSGGRALAVQLTIAGCDTAHAALNAQFAGLATYEHETPWDLGGYGPRMWLSTEAGSGPAALATFAVEF